MNTENTEKANALDPVMNGGAEAEESQPPMNADER
jgi:hypothetical protein